MFWSKFVELCVQKEKDPTPTIREIGLATSLVTQWKNGATPRATTLKKIADYFGVDPSYFTTDEKAPEKTPEQEKMGNLQIIDLPEYKLSVMLPVYGKVSAGLGDIADNEVKYYEPAFAKYGDGNYFYLEADGDSMEPKIQSGDLLLVQRTPSVDNGDIAVVLVDDEDGVVKKVIYDLQHIVLISLNPKYPPREFWKQDLLRLRVVGKVVMKVTKF